MSGGVQRTIGNLVKTNMFVNFHCSNYSPSTSSVLVSSTTATRKTKNECILRGHSELESYDQRVTCMVDKKFKNNQCPGHYSVFLTDTTADK